MTAVHPPLLYLQGAPPLALLLAVGMLAGACAVALPGGVPEGGLKRKTLLASGNETGTITKSGTYELSAAELALPCRRLSGRLQVRLLQVRNAPVAAPSTSSQALRQASAPVLKAGGYGTDPAADRARDLALIESYNKRLIELKCPSYDLARELNPAAGNTLPTPSKRP